MLWQGAELQIARPCVQTWSPMQVFFRNSHNCIQSSFYSCSNYKGRVHCNALQWNCSGTTVKWLQSGWHYSDPLYTLFHCTKMQVMTVITAVIWMKFLLQFNKCENYNQWTSAQKCSELTVNNENKRVRKLHTLVSKNSIEMNTIMIKIINFTIHRQHWSEGGVHV